VALIYALNHPFDIVGQIVASEDSITDHTRQNEDTPIHEVALTFAGIVSSLVVGSFLSYHLYLVSWVLI